MDGLCPGSKLGALSSVECSLEFLQSLAFLGSLLLLGSGRKGRMPMSTEGCDHSCPPGQEKCRS